MRQYARIHTAIWSDPHFLALPSAAQRLYHLINEQPEINLCGVIRPAYGRWATMAPDTTLASVRRAAGRLVGDSYILIDDTADELLVRAFVRYDVNLESPNTVVGLSKAFDSTVSQTLRRVIIEELEKAPKQGLLKGFAQRFPQESWHRLAKGFVKAWGNR